MKAHFASLLKVPTPCPEKLRNTGETTKNDPLWKLLKGNALLMSSSHWLRPIKPRFHFIDPLAHPATLCRNIIWVSSARFVPRKPKIGRTKLHNTKQSPTHKKQKKIPNTTKNIPNPTPSDKRCKTLGKKESAQPGGRLQTLKTLEPNPGADVTVRVAARGVAVSPGNKQSWPSCVPWTGSQTPGHSTTLALGSSPRPLSAGDGWKGHEPSAGAVGAGGLRAGSPSFPNLGLQRRCKMLGASKKQTHHHPPKKQGENTARGTPPTQRKQSATRPQKRQKNQQNCGGAPREHGQLSEADVQRGRIWLKTKQQVVTQKEGRQHHPAPVVLTPVVLTPVVLTPVVLTPVVLTPVVLNQKVIETAHPPRATPKPQTREEAVQGPELEGPKWKKKTKSSLPTDQNSSSEHQSLNPTEPKQKQDNLFGRVVSQKSGWRGPWAAPVFWGDVVGTGTPEEPRLIPSRERPHSR